MGSARAADADRRRGRLGIYTECKYWRGEGGGGEGEVRGASGWWWGKEGGGGDQSGKNKRRSECVCRPRSLGASSRGFAV